MLFHEVYFVIIYRKKIKKNGEGCYESLEIAFKENVCTADGSLIIGIFPGNTCDTSIGSNKSKRVYPKQDLLSIDERKDRDLESKQQYTGKGKDRMVEQQ